MDSDTHKISLCLTNYNRTDLLFESFAQVLDDPRIDEVVISDDCSTEENFLTVFKKFENEPKVKLFRNEINMDCYLNKAKAIERASNEWVIIFDSDNILTKEYLDRIPDNPDNRTIYQPEFARPYFDFRHLSGKTITKSNIAQYMDNRSTDTMLNAMNYFVNRNEYLKVFDYRANPVTSDSIYQNYRWLNAGNSIHVVPSLQYEHRVRKEDFGKEADSHYRVNSNRTPRGFHENIINKLKAMK